jgi:hypothetical protein
MDSHGWQQGKQEQCCGGWVQGGMPHLQVLGGQLPLRIPLPLHPLAAHPVLSQLRLFGCQRSVPLPHLALQRRQLRLQPLQPLQLLLEAC